MNDHTGAMKHVHGKVYVMQYCYCEYCQGHEHTENWNYIVDDSNGVSALELARRLATSNPKRLARGRVRQVDIDCGELTVAEYDPQADAETITIPESNNWADFNWPSWVPTELRRQIATFWAEDVGRGPAAWLEDAQRNASPPFGSLYTGEAFSPRRHVTGRFVHAWSNMARLVVLDGYNYVVIST
jgi:hypothetical protein